MSRNRGFTIIELLLWVAIAGLIAVIAIPGIIREPNAQTADEALTICNPQPRDGGVWFFTCNAHNFSLALGKFRTDHTELRVVTVATSSGEFGQRSATVVTEPASRCPAEAQ